MRKSLFWSKLQGEQEEVGPRRSKVEKLAKAVLAAAVLAAGAVVAKQHMGAPHLTARVSVALCCVTLAIHLLRRCWTR